MSHKSMKKYTFNILYISFLKKNEVLILIQMTQIDLNKVPENKLRSIASEKDINLNDCRTITDIREKLYAGITPDELWGLTSDYIFGGNTSILWFKYTPEDQTELPITKENITTILTELCDNENPFEIQRRPELTRTPQIINARFLDEYKVWVLFAVQGRLTGAFEDFEYRRYTPTDWINCIIRLNDNILEIRSNYNLAKKTANTFFFSLSQYSRYVHSSRYMQLTEEHLIPLKNELEATMRSYKGIDDTGEYESREYVGPSGDDIWVKQYFQEDIEGLYDPSSRLIFISQSDPETTITIKVNTRFGYVRFLSKYVSEDDINFVYNALKRINVIV